MTATSITGIMEAVTRAVLLVVVVIGLLTAGCGGDDGGDAAGDTAGATTGGGQSEVCQSLEDLQQTVQGVRDIELEEVTADDLQQLADDLTADVAAVGDAAGDELAEEVAAVETSVQDLSDEVETLAASSELTPESLSALAGPIASAATAFEGLIQAVPDCNL